MSSSVLVSVCMFALLSVACAQNKLLLLSFDGFRWDYFDRNLTPTFKSLISGGSSSVRMTGNYPTLTFPSHYTVVTGRHAEHHGIVGNTFYDPELDDVFDMGRTAQAWWYYNKTEPIWITAKKQGMRVGCYFWPGSETTFVIDGVSYAPDFWKKYDAGVAWKTRVDTVMTWFTTENVRFATLYTNQPDSVGHDYGTDSSQLNSRLSSLDADLTYLLQQLDAKGIRSTTDIIIVSDHGMFNTQKVLTLGGDFGLPSNAYTLWQYGAHIQMDSTSPANRDLIIEKLSASPDLNVYLKDKTPARFYYNAGNPRISEILVVPKQPGTYLRGGTSTAWPNKATHGWDNNFESMAAIFIANGPSFKKNYLNKIVKQVDIYPLMTYLLGIQGQAHDGDFKLISPVLAVPPPAMNRKHFRGSD